ncbi:MAG: signal peptidase II [candidate division Zixibacteria bacterium]|nr:signal peptidase II [candidate division Zixibacteria bacterium]
MQGKGRKEETLNTLKSGNGIYILTGLLVILIDQLTKWLVFFFMEENQSVSIIGDFFTLTFIYNPKGAFGFGSGAGSLYIFLSIIAMLVIVYYFQRSRGIERFLRFNLSLILGGALGNIIDRIFHGMVIDFMDFDFFDIYIEQFTILGYQFSGYQLYRWPVFNIADIAVSLGTAGVIGYIITHPNFPVRTTESDDKDKISSKSEIEKAG